MLFLTSGTTGSGAADAEREGAVDAAEWTLKYLEFPMSLTVGTREGRVSCELCVSLRIVISWRG